MRAGAKTIGGAAEVLPPPTDAAERLRRPAIRPFFQNFRIDLFGAAGIVILIILWWGLTFAVPPSSLPGITTSTLSWRKNGSFSSSRVTVM